MEGLAEGSEGRGAVSDVKNMGSGRGEKQH